MHMIFTTGETDFSGYRLTHELHIKGEVTNPQFELHTRIEGTGGMVRQLGSGDLRLNEMWKLAEADAEHLYQKG